MRFQEAPLRDPSPELLTRRRSYRTREERRYFWAAPEVRSPHCQNGILTFRSLGNPRTWPGSEGARWCRLTGLPCRCLTMIRQSRQRGWKRWPESAHGPAIRTAGTSVRLGADGVRAKGCSSVPLAWFGACGIRAGSTSIAAMGRVGETAQGTCWLPAVSPGDPV